MAAIAVSSMRRPDRRTVLAIGLAALAAFLVLMLTRANATTPILVASTGITAGQPLSSADVSVRMVASSDGLISGTELGSLTGWSLVADLRAGEPLLPSLLVDPARVPRPSSLSIAVPQTHAALGTIEPGDLVDIYVTWPATGGSPARTELLVSGVTVLDAHVNSDRLGSAPDVELLFAVDDVSAPLIAGGHRGGELDLVRVAP